MAGWQVLQMGDSSGVHFDRHKVQGIPADKVETVKYPGAGYVTSSLYPHNCKLPQTSIISGCTDSNLIIADVATQNESQCDNLDLISCLKLI